MLAFPIVPLYLDPLKTTTTKHHVCAKHNIVCHICAKHHVCDKHNIAWHGAEREQWVRPSWGSGAPANVVVLSLVPGVVAQHPVSTPGVCRAGDRLRI